LNLWGSAIFHGPHLFLGPALVGALIALILTESHGTGAIRARWVKF